MLVPTAAAPMAIEVLLREPRVVEGGVAALSLRVTAEQDLTVVGGRVDLVRREDFQHHMAGMFNVRARHREVVASAPLPGWGRMLAAERLEVAGVELPVPAGSLGSTDGRLIKIGWELRASVATAATIEAVATAELVVLTRALDRAEDARRPPSVADRGCAALAVEGLASRTLRSGVLAGAVVIAPTSTWVARAAHVALIRREHVEHGIWLGGDPARNPPDQEKDAEVTVSRQHLADRLHLEPGRPERLAFALHVPQALLAPSLRTEEFEISWVLRAWLDRPWRRNPVIEVGLHAPTAPQWR